MSYEGKLIYFYRNGEWVSFDYVTGYKVTFCKLWSSDTGRAVNGDNKGTLIGIFPKLSITLGKMGEYDTSVFLQIVNKQECRVKYYDPEYRRTVENSFYFGDAVTDMKRKKQMIFNPTEISVIANKKRR